MTIASLRAAGYRSRRLLVTGANGFIGRHLLAAAVQAGRVVTAVILPGSDRRGLPPSVRVVELDLAAAVADRGMQQRLTECLSEVAAVVNLAGSMVGASIERFRRANLATAAGLLAAWRRCDCRPRLVHASSVAAVGPAWTGEPLAEDAPPRPVCAYGRSKLAAERLLTATGVLRRHPGGDGARLPVVGGDPAKASPDRSATGNLVVARLCSVFGPGDPCFLSLFRWAARGIHPRIGVRGRRFNLIFVKDLVRILLLLADRADLVGVLNVGDPVIHTDDSFSRTVATMLGVVPCRRWFVPRGLARLVGRLYDLYEAVTGVPELTSSGKIAELCHRDWLQSFGRLTRVLPEVKFTGFSEACRQTVAAYRAAGWLL